MNNETALLLVASMENLTRVLEHNAKLIREMNEAIERLVALYGGERDLALPPRPN